MELPQILVSHRSLFCVGHLNRTCYCDYIHWSFFRKILLDLVQVLFVWARYYRVLCGCAPRHSDIRSLQSKKMDPGCSAFSIDWTANDYNNQCGECLEVDDYI